MQLQSKAAKLGEITFRAKIAKQHKGTKRIFKNEPNAQEFEKILKNRLKEYRFTFSNLKKRGLLKSPFLEIGAEYSLASTLLINDYKASGIATDISLHSLKEAPYFAKKFYFSRLPTTICADAANLPFEKNSFPLVLIYESLHHFPDPLPPIKEIYRVLAPGGICLIGGDPVAQTLQLKLWRRPTKLRSWEKLLKLTAILPFISHIGKTEVDHGILEEAFSLKTWQKSLSVFDRAEITLKTQLGFSQLLTKKNQKNWLRPKLSVILSLLLLGGGLQAICFKKGTVQPHPLKTESSLICPTCRLKLKKEFRLFKKNQSYFCTKCNSTYKKYFGILTLLEKSLEKAVVFKN